MSQAFQWKTEQKVLTVLVVGWMPGRKAGRDCGQVSYKETVLELEVEARWLLAPGAVSGEKKLKDTSIFENHTELICSEMVFGA